MDTLYCRSCLNFGYLKIIIFFCIRVIYSIQIHRHFAFTILLLGLLNYVVIINSSGLSSKFISIIVTTPLLFSQDRPSSTHKILGSWLFYHESWLFNGTTNVCFLIFSVHCHFFHTGIFVLFGNFEMTDSTVLMVACQHNQSAIVLMLLRRWFSIYKSSSNGWLPMCTAANYDRHHDGCKILLRYCCISEFKWTTTWVLRLHWSTWPSPAVTW